MVWLFKEELMANLALSTAATVFLVWAGVFPGWSFKSLFPSVFAVNFPLQLIWDIVIYPYFVSPLRHLPLVPVPLSPFFLILYMLKSAALS